MRVGRAPTIVNLLPAMPDVSVTRRERGPHQGWNDVGGAGQPGLQGNWQLARKVSFAKWHHGFVSLRGELRTVAAATSDTFFTLPAGYRPPREHRALAYVITTNEQRPLIVRVSTDGRVYMPNLVGVTVTALALDSCIFAVR